ncbi:MAG: Crp/Fnr family transcriptional regulator [Rhodospirillales bacterium]|nr:Crp/Fnr family transcriptional regulator [Rhodospirillales bacterium]
MKKNVQNFSDGDIIFRESDTSNSLYILAQGNVELSKSGERGPVMLAMLNPGEMFGEMGILDGGLRSATATAIGPVVIEETERQDFLDALTTEPDLALNVMGKLVERLRQANDRLTHPSTAIEKIQKGGSGFSVFRMFKKLSGANDGGSGRIEIRVFPFLGEVSEVAEVQRRHVIQSLSKRPGIKIKALKNIPEIDPDLHPDDRLMKLHDLALEAMASSYSDLIIYADIPAPGTTLHLHFFSARSDDDDRPGFTLPSSVLTLPVDFEPELAELLLAVALAATTTHEESKRVRLGQALSETLYAAMPAVQNLPQDLTTRERASIQMCYGNAIATLAYQRGTAELYQVAVQTYRAALEHLSRDDNLIDWALTQKHLGASLQAIADRSNDEDTLNQAAEALEAALEAFRPDTYPIIWASTQNRLGAVLYKLDLKTGDAETLKKSLNAFQAALHIFNRTDHPSRWADVMNNFAQAAQVLGEQLHSTEVLEKAVNACLGALEIRRKEKGPLLWAATQNNLGSALFLLGKLTHDVARLEGAAAAFDQALGVYSQFNADRLASVARKNLSKVHLLLDESNGPTERNGSKIPTLDWEKSAENNS